MLRGALLARSAGVLCQQPLCAAPTAAQWRLWDTFPHGPWHAELQS